MPYRCRGTRYTPQLAAGSLASIGDPGSIDREVNRTGQLDMNTTITVAAATLLLIGLVILLYGAGGRLRWAPAAWGLGNIAHAAGLLWSVAPGYLSHPGQVILANLLIMGALALLWFGTAYFMGVHRPAWLFVLPPLITVLAFPVLLYVLPSQPLRVVLVSVLTVVGCGDSGRLLMGGRHNPTRVLGWVLIGVALLSGLRAMAGVAAVLFAEPFTSMIRLELHAPTSLLLFTFWSVGMVVAAADRSERELSDMVEELRVVSLTDQLTQLRNRRYMQQRLEEGAARLERHGEVFSVLLIDADQFKQINDTFGHDCGDYVLRTMAHTLERVVQSADLLARWGGEEFFVLVPDGAPAAARELAERLRKAMAELALRYDAAAFKITVTIGGATAARGESLADLIRRADHAMYLGKRRGRNRVEWG